MKPYFETDNGKLYNGDILSVLADMPAESVNCVITSPPYWGLRDYSIEPVIWDGDKDCKHEWGSEYLGDTRPYGAGLEIWQKGAGGAKHIKVSQGTVCTKCNAWKGSLGLEPTFQLYIQHLIQIFIEIKRVLKLDGTCWVNMGDSYASSGGCNEGFNERWHGKQYLSNKQGDTDRVRPKRYIQNISPKSLCQIPQRFSIAMTDNGWILRNVIIWYKRNCMPSSANDRFTVDFEYLYFFVKNKSYWFEQQYEDALLASYKRNQAGKFAYNRAWNNKHCPISGGKKVNIKISEQGRNKRCVWDIPTQPFPEAHFAVYPEDLCVTPIKAGCPEYICKKCGKAREKIFEYETIGTKRKERGAYYHHDGHDKTCSYLSRTNIHGTKRAIEKGYTDCGCNAGFEPGVVLDPFAGAGTTLLVAEKLGRKWIGIEISKEYCDIAVERLKKETDQLKLGM